ncbi:hypothetical protein KCU76_g113, partial [Aureobasidium melanogenum]
LTERERTFEFDAMGRDGEAYSCCGCCAGSQAVESNSIESPSQFTASDLLSKCINQCRSEKTSTETSFFMEPPVETSTSSINFLHFCRHQKGIRMTREPIRMLSKCTNQCDHGSPFIEASSFSGLSVETDIGRKHILHLYKHWSMILITPLRGCSKLLCMYAVFYTRVTVF